MTDSMISAEASTETQAPDVGENEAGQETQAEENKETASEGEDGYLYAGKYQSIDELEKGYKEAVTKLTQKNPGAPEEYDFDFSDNEALKDAKIDLNEDYIFKAAIPVFKEVGITQDQAKKIVSKVLESTMEQIPDIGEELKKLGADGPQIVSEVNRFVSRSLTEDEKDIAIMLGQTADGVSFMHKLVKLAGEKSIPGELDPGSVMSAAEAKAEAFEYRRTTPNFENDAAAKARYEKMMDDAIKIELREKGKRVG